METKITIKGAREHNLRNVNLEIPRNKMIVFTGISGSGKSSLAFDTIFAEGQRRYLESLSSYARQFLGGMNKPDVNEISGLSPAISIDQKAHSSNPRSTVATITEVYDYLRILYAKIGQPYCPLCQTPLEKVTTDEINDHLIERLKNTKEEKNKTTTLSILSPIVRGRKGEYHQLLYDIYNNGFVEARIDGKFKSLKNRVVLTKNKKHTIEIVIDKITLINPDTIEQSPSVLQRIAEAVENAAELSDGLCTVIYPNSEEKIFSTDYSCPHDGYSFPEIEPRLFSFNSPYGYCNYCTGLGTKELFSEEVCPKCEGKRLNENALSVKINKKNICQTTDLNIREALEFIILLEKKLTAKQLEIAGVIIGEVRTRLQFMLDVGLHYLTLNRRGGTLSGGEAQRIRLASQVSTKLVGALYILDEPTIGLHQKDNDQLISTLRNLCDTGNTIIIVEHDENTILTSDWLVDIGPAAGVHGGKIVYNGPLNNILDSKQALPKIALDCQTQGSAKDSLTGQYLRNEKSISLPERRRKVDKKTPVIKITGAKEHNLKNIKVEIPLRRLICLTGVSGSGKSTLMHDTLYRAIQNKKFRMNKWVGKHKSVTGIESIDKVIKINQAPIGRTPRSNPATYTKAFDYIRDIFASTQEARIRGYNVGRFSFNKPGGRCENCEGRGHLQIEMHFLPSVEVICDICKGKRYNKETLQVHYKGKNISDVLSMTIEESKVFFRDVPFIYDKLKVLSEVGLDYLTLGQSATTLSGGEAQRIKLSRELAKRNTTNTLYLMDEPTVGLHYDDVKKLLDVIQRLVSQGNTAMIIEHNLDIIKCADWLIDLGPEGGDGGGEVVKVGTPEEVARYGPSWTGQYLKRILKS
ncbi:excinuclease ABC subunit UvrA [Candidatus Falkowbacteria bacterium]|jgi:excinuclease ABC subunit A|nr:excinuclease ABC subunit UvrA [Candidatus Falkowbacteria bacterium]MBT5502634.1 excinuclease ABC subunit UvrA [Candidatus Falkowbacteria bacterium]MBT6574427.1 excinuclease ABC subunit UvrA [Candidatus Falkowbacteria bacterium]MBT7348963.1 excinuclease ABC subunit UvrA [Candidatus Falkowbacteria bacterium]MBT7500310.1 excinuclease ABC subunit UvrA [Candidatus Falkowbacteria bacterium]